MPDVVLALVLVGNKLGVSSIDSVVRQMHEQVFQIALHWWLVRFSCKTSQSFFKHVHSQWITPENQDVDS